MQIRATGLIPEWGRSPGGGHGIPLQYSCLENPRDGGAWWAAVYGVAQSRTRLKRLSRSSIENPLSAAARSYPTSEIRGRSREDPMPEGQRPRGVTPRPRSGAAATRTNPTPPHPHARGQGRQPGGPTPRPRSGGCAGAGGPRGAILR